MSVFDSVYWQMPVFAQKFMGIWPYNHGTLYNKVMPICFYIALYSLVIPMGIRMVNEVGVHNLIALENLMGQLYLHGALIKLSLTIVYKKELKAVYDLIANDWKVTQDKEELKIMEDHARLGRKLSIFYLICCTTTAGCFLSIPVFKPLLDFVVPLENASRPLMLPYYAEYYIDQQKYYFPLITKAFIAGTMSMIVFVTYDMSFAMCVQHVCSLFDIISLRLQRASKLSSNPTAINNYTLADREIFRNMVEAIELHKIVITNINILEDAYNICWFFILILNTVGLGGVLVIVTIKITKFLCFFVARLHIKKTELSVLQNIKIIEELIRYGMFFLIIFIHKYYVFLPGQKIINYSLLVIEECYSCDWFQMSPRCKSLIRLMMLRSIRSLELTGGKMFVLCMATYAAMLKAGMSYFTMLANTR